jgi:hypothetical protein
MNAPPLSGITGRTDDAGYDSHVRACPRCNGSVYRIHRRVIDKLVCIFIPIRRYRCHSDDCRWEGNLRVKRH